MIKFEWQCEHCKNTNAKSFADFEVNAKIPYKAQWGGVLWVKCEKCGCLEMIDLILRTSAFIEKLEKEHKKSAFEV